MQIAGIIPAAGSGQRLGGGRPKGLRLLGGKPLYQWAWESLANHPDISYVVIAAPAADCSAMTVEIERARQSGSISSTAAVVNVVAGGATRQESVACALAAVPSHLTQVLVHDAARPFANRALIDRVIAALAAGFPAVIPALPVVDTVKQVKTLDGYDCPSYESVVATVDREKLRAVQTPQGFDLGLLQRVHAAALSHDLHCTDDAMMLENQAIPVTVVPGAPEAFKITTQLDFTVAECLLQRSRIG